MTSAQKTFDLYRQLGILNNCKSLAISRDNSKNRWEVWGHFQSNEGRKNARVAMFDDVTDAVDFRVLFETA
jgi:hypothetical protein